MNEQAAKKMVETQRRDGDRIKKLAKRANKGDDEALGELRTLLGTAEWDVLVNRFGDMAEHAEAALLAKVCGDNRVFAECVRRKLETLRLDMSGPSPTPIERLLVERVVACWLHVYQADHQAALNLEKSVGMCEQLARIQDRAQKRYLSAIKTLVVVRRLALPIKLDVSVAGSVTTKTAERTPTPRRLLPIGSEN